MTTGIAARRTSPAAGLVALTEYETRRFVRSPVFLVASGLTAWSLWDGLRVTVTEVNTVTVYPAIFLGGLGMVTAFRLTRSTQRSAEAVNVSPTTPQARTAAICLVAIVPLLCGWLSCLAIMAFLRVPGDWTYGTLSTSGRAALLIGQTVVPALGGPLLGVALGRWVRFPGAAPVLFLVIFGWVILADVLAAAHRNSMLVLMMRLFAPFTFFTASDQHAVETWRGSPWFFVGWQLCLCAVAVTVALLRDAEPGLRSRLTRILIVVLAAAALMYALTVTGGLGHAVISYPGKAPRPI
jgi:hypothetical protein